jgi:integrase
MFKLEVRRRPGSWDMGVDFVKLYRAYLAAIRKFRRDIRKFGKKEAELKLTKTAILLIQLLNGSRAGEAIEAAKKFAKGEGVKEVTVKGSSGENTKVRVVYVRVEKARTKKVNKETGEVVQLPEPERMMVLPLEIKDSDLQIMRKHVDRMYVALVSMFAKKTFGVNTHTARHAATSYYVAEMGRSPEEVARMQGRRSPVTIYNYVQSTVAERTLLRTAISVGKTLEVEEG